MAQTRASIATKETATRDDRNGESKVRDITSDISNDARTLVDQVVAYTKAHPVEAAAIAAGIAFVAGAAVVAPRLLQSRPERDYQRLLKQAYQEAERVRNESSGGWNRLTDWVSANVPHVR